MSERIIELPDLGADEVEVIEICVAVGDTVAEEDSLLVLESDKASMEVPAPAAGTVLEILVQEGDTVATGHPVMKLTQGEGAVASEPEQDSLAEPADTRSSDSSDAPVESEAAKSTPSSEESAEPQLMPIAVPDIGSPDAVELIEVCVSAGEDVAEGDSLMVLESDKASMEIPSPVSGRISELLVAEGAQLRQGDLIAYIETRDNQNTVNAESPNNEASASQGEAETVADAAPAPASAPVVSPVTATETPEPTDGEQDALYAGPAVRKLAREFGLSLAEVKGSGPRGRILKEDLQAYVKNRVAEAPQAATTGAGIPVVPVPDFAKFGDVDVQPMSKLHRVTAQNMQRSWLNVPHVTQWDDADVTELETFRKSLKAEAEQRGTKLTPMPFLLKAAAAALRKHPLFNASLAADGEHIVYKQYVHIGMAVDTPAGLVVPVIRDVDRKGLFELAEETAALAAKAKARKLSPADMQGGCFTVSSLGSLGGRGFTPIVNTPEVAILGVAKLAVQPQWDGEQFQPRSMLPLSLSYDHRLINGADAGRFFADLSAYLQDIRRLVL